MRSGGLDASVHCSVALRRNKSHTGTLRIGKLNRSTAHYDTMNTLLRSMYTVCAIHNVIHSVIHSTCATKANLKT